MFYPETSCVIIWFCNREIKSRNLPDQSLISAFHPNIAYATFMHIPIITVKTENYNLISQDFYNKTIDYLDLNLISCVCGHSGCLIRYGSYRRSIQLADRVLSLSVIRVYCKACGHTHALLLSSMIPYSQIPLVLHVRLIHAYEHETRFRNILAEQYLVDENNLKSIIRNYRLHWKQRLLSMRLHLPDIPSLISGCFSLFSRQFMQIKSTSNKLFILPT